MLQSRKARGWLLMLLTVLTIAHRTNTLMRCKQELLKNFYLLGMPIAIVEKMHICPHVHDKCCSIADEVKISHLWNNHTQAIVTRYSDTIVNNINMILRSFFKVVALDPEMMVLKYVVPRQVPFKYKQCTTVKNVIETAQDKRELKEYSTGFMRYLNKNVWKFRMKKKKKVKRAKGGFSNEKITNYVTQTRCTTHTDMFYREFVVVNQEKTEYCIGIHDKYMDFRIKDFISLLPQVKNSLTFMVNMKRAFYCHLCDAHMHKFFDLEKKTIQMSKGFCNRLLRKQIDYFKFMHIILIEFSSQLLQYQACFETDGAVFEFPFRTFMTKYLRRIPIIKKCLSSLTDKKSFYKNCWMICEQYQYYTFSTFFDGDQELLRRINVSLLSFQRKLTRAERWQEKLDQKSFKFAKLNAKERAGAIGKELLLPENVDGTLIEPLNPSHMITDKKHYFRRDDRIRLVNTPNPNSWSVGYRSDQVKTYYKLKHKLLTKKLKKKFALVKGALKAKIAAMKGKWVPPKKKPFKLPLKAPVISTGGELDRLSTVRFKEHLHSGLYPQRSLFMTRSDNATPEEAAYKMNISDDEKQEMLKSFGNQPGPEPRELSLVDDGDSQGENFDFAHTVMNVGSSLSRKGRKLKNKAGVNKKSKHTRKLKVEKKAKNQVGSGDSMDNTQNKGDEVTKTKKKKGPLNERILSRLSGRRRRRQHRRIRLLRRKLRRTGRKLRSHRRRLYNTHLRRHRLSPSQIRAMRRRTARLRRERLRRERLRRAQVLKRAKMRRLRNKLNRMRTRSRHKMLARKRYLLRRKRRKLRELREAEKRELNRLRRRKRDFAHLPEKERRARIAELKHKFARRRNRILRRKSVEKNQMNSKPAPLTKKKFNRNWQKAKKNRRKVRRKKKKAINKKRHRSKRAKKKKKAFKHAVKDKLTKRKKYQFGDFFAKKQKDHPKRPKKMKKVHYPFALRLETIHQIFERIEEKINIGEFSLTFEKEGLNPLHNIELINYRYNITRLIEMRYKLPEQMSATAVNQYMLVNSNYVKGFNHDLDKEIDVFEDVHEINLEINWYKQLRKKVMIGNKNPMYIQKINNKIRQLTKKAKENAARREVVKKAMKNRMNRKGHTDLNYNKYPYFHHHHDLYFNDTFHGIAEMFTHIFGS